MPSSDAILIGEDWISEHFFTTDATSQSFQARVIARRKDWDAAETPTPRSRFTAERAALETEISELTSPNGATDAAAHVEAARAVYETLRTVLGYDDPGYHTHRTGPVLAVSAPGITAGAPLVLVEATPVDAVDDMLEKDASTLLEPWQPDEQTTLTSVPRLLSAVFVAEDGPDFALVLAGRWLLVAEKVRWAEGRYLALDLQLVCERNETKRGGEIDRALTCISAESLAPDADGNIWWAQALEESVKHTVGVSQDLREGVRLSIEIIANEVVSRRREKGLPPLPAELAQPLAKQALRFLYRILFLLYAEASPELEVLPAGASEYEQGYSLDRLRELTLVQLATPQGKSGTHLYESLALLFRLVDAGHAPPAAVSHDDGASAATQGLTFQSLRADLFMHAATALIDEVGLGNEALQRVLRHLLLSKETGGKDRGFISYAELGINQLGAVYEGLMSYTGFFATEDLYEVAKNGDSAKGSWVVPVHRATGIAEADFVRAKDEVTGELKPVVHEAGTFVFRLAGRERQQSASYYTPEVLTRFTVSQALEELLDQDGTTKAEDILHLTVCEPALGSGAFAIEAVRQLAEQYLRRRQEETGQRIDPDAYPRELQRVKAYLALHQVYGVDLNATAVELAEISLWLDTMAADLNAPWFGLHLRRGNSLIGARHATYSQAQVKDKSWLAATPTDHPLTELAADLASGVRTSTTGAIHHFLLPAAGWGSAVEAKEARALAPDATAALKAWSRATATKPTATQLKTLLDVADRVEVLWQFALRRLQIAEYEARRDIPVWGHEAEPSGRAVSREDIETSLADGSGAYQRLRRVMDAWAALWFWPLTETETKPPTLAQWLDALQQLLGRDTTQAKAHGKRSYEGMDQLGAHSDWNALNDAEKLDLGFADAQPITKVLDTHPWLTVCERVATQQGFFHWELDFATVFARGGFDLQLGNPPWVRPDWDEAAILGEYELVFALDGKIEANRAARLKGAVLDQPEPARVYLEELGVNAANRELVSSPVRFPQLEGLRPDLYRCFMEQTWRNGSATGTVGLIHLETHFTDERAGFLRAASYERLRRHWHFVNELKLFEIQDQKNFGVNVYGAKREAVSFYHGSWLYHPDTVQRSLRHDGSGDEPGLKDPEGNWDVRPHAGRIIEVTDDVLRTWHAILEDENTPLRQARMLHTVNRVIAKVLEKTAESERVGNLGLEFSQGWNETTDFKRGYFEKEWGVPGSWDDVILQGPHLYVSTPMYKSPNPTMKHQQDWSEVDFESLAPDAIPATSYKPAGDPYEYDVAYTDWGTDAHPLPARDFYRIAWRSMAANTGERTLIPALIPPGPTQLSQSVYSMGLPKGRSQDLCVTLGSMSSLLADAQVRSAPKSAVLFSVVQRLACPGEARLLPYLLLRTLRLNAITDAYADLWREVYDPAFSDDSWACGRWRENRPALGGGGPEWTAGTPLRIAEDRRQALVEIDALVALMLGVTADELCTVYRTQFAVLYGYDRHSYVYDTNGRLVPTPVLQVWRRKGDGMSVEERTTTNQAGNTYTYELPFRLLDREADMRQAYTHFERILREKTQEGDS